MTPTLPPRRTNSDRLLRLLPVAAGLMLILAAPASAQLPIPPLGASVPTPLGTTEVQAGPDGVKACTHDAISTGGLPVQLPMDLPAEADASLDACAAAGLGGVDARISQDAAVTTDVANARAGIDASQDGGKVEADTGFFSMVIDWFVDLF